MLCSECSRVIHPVVAIDIDGTLGNYHGHFWDLRCEWLGVPVPDATSYRGGDPYAHWFCDSYGVDITTFRTIKLAYRQGGMKRSMPVHEHSTGMMYSLAKQAEVWVTTTRPHDRYRGIDPDTVEWLRRHDIKYDGLLFDEDKFDELYRRVDAQRVVAVLDDEPGVLWQVVQGVPVLLRTPYNAEAEWDGVQAASLPEAWRLTQWIPTNMEGNYTHDRHSLGAGCPAGHWQHRRGHRRQAASGPVGRGRQRLPHGWQAV